MAESSDLAVEAAVAQVAVAVAVVGVVVVIVVVSATEVVVVGNQNKENLAARNINRYFFVEDPKFKRIEIKKMKMKMKRIRKSVQKLDEHKFVRLLQIK